MAEQSIIETVKSLMRLAENPGAHEGEKQSARAKADLLIKKHSIQSHELDELTCDYILKFFQLTEDMAEWGPVLVAGVCYFNHCLMLTGESPGRVFISGKPEDILRIERKIAEYDRQIKHGVKSYLFGYIKPSVRGNINPDHFCLGVSRAIIYKLWQRSTEPLSQNSSSQSVTYDRRLSVEAYLSKVAGKAISKETQSTKDPDTKEYHDGVEYGIRYLTV